MRSDFKILAACSEKLAALYYVLIEYTLKVWRKRVPELSSPLANIVKLGIGFICSEPSLEKNKKNDIG